MYAGQITRDKKCKETKQTSKNQKNKVYNRNWSNTSNSSTTYQLIQKITTNQYVLYFRNKKKSPSL
jgi:hypothetical protein